MINGCIGRLGLGLMLGLFALACGSKSGAVTAADTAAVPPADPTAKKTDDEAKTEPSKSPKKNKDGAVGTSESDAGGGGGGSNNNNNNNNGDNGDNNNNNNDNGDDQQQTNNNGDSRSASGDNCCYNGTYLRCPNSAACFGGFDVNACTDACGGEFDCSMDCLTKMGNAGPPTSSCKKATPPPNVQCGG